MENYQIIKMEKGIPMIEKWVSQKLASYMRRIKEMEKERDKIRKFILEEMEIKKIISIETDDLKINYINSTDREIFDEKRFKKECPDTYDAFVKMVTVKPNIRIMLKEQKDG